MRNKRSIRVIAWILSVMLLVTSLGLDSLTVSAAQTGATGEEQSVVSETVQDEGTTDGPVAEPDASVSATGDGFTYTADFTTGYNTASMVFTLEKIGESEPSGSNNIDIYIRPTASTADYQQIGWYTGLSDTHQVTVSNLQYQQTLTPGVSYDLKIALRHNNNIIGEAVTSFSTKSITVTSTLNQVTWFSADYSFEVADKDLLAAEGITELKVYPFVQEKGGTPVAVNWGYYNIDLLKDDLSISNLKDDTEYTLYLSGSATSEQPAMYQTTFKTSKDTRKVELSSTEVQYCYAKFFLNVSGGRDDVETKTYLFLRKKRY